MKLTEDEMAVLADHEDALAVLIAFHEVESKEPGYGIHFRKLHSKRAEQLRAHKKALPLRFR